MRTVPVSTGLRSTSAVSAMTGTTSVRSGESFAERDTGSTGRRTLGATGGLLGLRYAGCAFSGRNAVTGALHRCQETYVASGCMMLLTAPYDSRRTHHVPMSAHCSLRSTPVPSAILGNGVGVGPTTRLRQATYGADSRRPLARCTRVHQGRSPCSGRPASLRSDARSLTCTVSRNPDPPTRRTRSTADHTLPADGCCEQRAPDVLTCVAAAR
jgi:hypothetical protein